MVFFSAATRLVCKQNKTNTAPMTHGLGVLVLHVHQSTRLATTRSVAGRTPTGFVVALCWFSLPFRSPWLQSVVFFPQRATEHVHGFVPEPSLL